MRALVDFAIASVDFVRAESQRLRKGVFASGLLVALCFVAGLLIFFGLASILGSLFLALNEQVTAPTAALLTGLFTLVVAMIVLWVTKRMAI